MVKESSLLHKKASLSQSRQKKEVNRLKNQVIVDFCNIKVFELLAKTRLLYKMRRN